MQLLRELTRLQQELGYLPDATLEELSRRRRIPLYALEGLVSFYPAFRRTPPPRHVVHVCRDVCCQMAGGKGLGRQLAAHYAERDDIELREVSCLGRCDAAPAVSVHDIPLAPQTLADLVNGSAPLAQPRDEITPSAAKPTGGWRCDPYPSADKHYDTLRSLIAAGDELGATCIRRLQESQLFGMGGAGFPTARKWELVARETAERKYVICNADESEPGTFKDRVILAELPHLVIEGMILAGLTIGATRGIVYLRHEYGPEQRALESAISAARKQGVLGDDAAGSGTAFEIEVFVSPGGYILGEETALLEALEDKRGEPRNKPPYPGTHGLWGRPTLINNVETLALTAAIVHHGSDWWHRQGKGSYSGLKFCSVSGDVAEPGVFEIPFGTTVADLIDLAGGMRENSALKAFLPGGASSNFLPASAANTPIDFEALRAAGSMLGTGALIVVAEGRDLFALATNLVRFFRNESCGKCVPCREGSARAVQLLEQIQAGDSNPDLFNVLPVLGETLEQTSICGLGQVALNPILSMMKHFPDELGSGTED